MDTLEIAEIEKRIDRLPLKDQLRLIERVARRLRLRESSITEKDSLEEQLSTMARDPEVQRELRAIAGEFSVTEFDGLE